MMLGKDLMRSRSNKNASRAKVIIGRSAGSEFISLHHLGTSV